MNGVQKTVDISVAQISLQELLTFINEGTEILLTDSRKPLARLFPVVQQNIPRIAGLHLGAISTNNDFDEPLPEDFWTAGT